MKVVALFSYRFPAVFMPIFQPCNISCNIFLKNDILHWWKVGN